MNQDNFKGNERQLKLLLKAVRENNIHSWNKFVKSNGKYFVANLEGVNLSFLDLREINLTGANLVNANLEGANLTRAKMDRVKLMKANLNSSNLSKATIINSFLTDADLSKVEAKGADLSKSDLTGVNLDGSNLEDTNITGTIMKNASLNGCKISGAKKNRGVKIKPKAKKRVLTEDEEKKLSPWKVAKMEETLRRVEREEKEKLEESKLIEAGLKSRDKKNIYIVGETE